MQRYYIIYLQNAIKELLSTVVEVDYLIKVQKLLVKSKYAEKKDIKNRT